MDVGGERGGGLGEESTAVVYPSRRRLVSKLIFLDKLHDKPLDNIVDKIYTDFVKHPKGATR